MQDYNYNYLKRFFVYLKPYANSYYTILSLVLFSALVSLPAPLITKYVVDTIIPTKNYAQLNIFVLLMLGLYFAGAGLSAWVGYMYSRLGIKVSYDIRQKIFTHLQSLPLRYLNRQAAGDTVSRIINDVNVVNGLLTSSAIRIITSIVTFIGIVIVCLYLNWQLTILNLITIPLFCYLSTIMNTKLRAISRSIQEQAAVFMSDLYESVYNQKTVRAFNLEDIFLKKFLAALDKLIDFTLYSIKLGILVSQISSVIMAIGPMFVLWYGTRLVFSGVLTLGGLFAFYQYLGQIYSPVRSLVGFNLRIQKAWGAITRINEFLDTESEDDDRGSEIQLSGRISFNNVNFSYDGANPVLKQVSLEIGPGDYVGIVGPSGSGKTTIVNLLMKFYRGYDGEILLDNYSLSDLNTRSLREQIGIITQDPCLFKCSIKENIDLGRTGSTLTEIRQAAAMAQIDDFIMNLPDQYDTFIEEKGENVSRGQKQRIALARLFLRKPRIIVFDEATSSLDSSLESLIQDTIVKSARQTTFIVISHRLSSVINAQKIMVIEDGMITEEGNHFELVRKEGRYYNLYMKQLMLESPQNMETLCTIN
jgi:ABC-type bacteriocin/lantibiotic exporter with double-glycine peptidase domain